MKIQRIELRRFKSIREVILPEHNSSQVLDNLVVLIGRNSSGKTNLLEAIDYFFREFDSAFERAIGSLNLELWHGREALAPIEWDVTLKLEQSETLVLLGKDLEPIFEGVTNKDQVRVLRQIVATPSDMRWHTSALAVGNIDLIKDTKAVTPEEIMKALNRPEPVPANLVQSILSNLSGLLRSQFKYIGAARDSVQPAPSFGNRSPIINPTTLASINNLAQGAAADVRNKWRPLRKKMETTLPNRERVDSKVGQLFLGDEPFPATGGGAQSVLALIHDIETAPPIVAIEEPENHLHPELIKKTLRYFQDITAGPSVKQLFVATHSPFFVDSSYIRGIVALYWDGQETKAQQIGTKEDLRTTLFDIGARPSDIFFADLILIVEGESDKIVLQGWARTLDVPLEEIHAAVVPARGVSKTRYHLKLWAEISKEIDLPRYVIVDKSGQDEVNAAVSAGLVETDNAHTLERGDLEDYYLTDVLIDALQRLFDVTVAREDIPEGGRVKTINKLLKKGPEEWKVPLAEEVSKRTERQQIPKEVGDFLRRVYNENMR